MAWRGGAAVVVLLGCRCFCLSSRCLCLGNSINNIQVVIQVYREKGILMAPLHHHYEVKGWEETKVVMLFWIITIVLVLVGCWLSDRRTVLWILGQKYLS